MHVKRLKKRRENLSLYEWMNCSDSHDEEEESIPLMYQEQMFRLNSHHRREKRLKSWLIVISIMCLLLFAAVVVLSVFLERFATSQPNNLWPEPSSTILAHFPRAIVVSDNGRCSEIGREILIRNGSAIDAIIATNICQGATNAQSSGIGGGFFLTYYDRGAQTCYAIDARETAPAAVNENTFSGKPDDARYGWKAVGVPGEVSGMWLAHQNFGRLPWESLWQPTIDLLEAGFPVTGSMADAIQSSNSTLERLTAETGLDIFVNPSTGQAYRAGEILRRPKLAETMKKIAHFSDNGNYKTPVDLFYRGSVMQDIMSEVKKNGGYLTESDFGNYTAILRSNKVDANIPGTEVNVCGPPPPSSAAIIAGILKILSAYPANQRTFNDKDSAALLYHRILESLKFGFAVRSTLGDSSFVPSALSIAANVTTDEWAARIRSLIQTKTQAPEYYGGDYMNKIDSGTSHMSALDQFGNAVALTASVNLYFGAKVRSKTTGIVMNDHLDDFSVKGEANAFGLPPSPENFPEAGKRPQSSMSPVIFYRKDTGNVKMVLGASGGSRIITAVSQAALRMLWANATIKEAVDAPRVHNQLYPDVTGYDSHFPEVIRDILVSKYGHNMEEEEPREFSAVSGIMRLPDGTLLGNADYRKPGGYPAGF